MTLAIPEKFVFEETLHGGRAWSFAIRRGYTLRITDTEGGANVSALFYNNEEKSERYNMPDTLKAQHTAFLTKGFVCYSDMGRILFSITEDTCGWHDTICGVSNKRIVEEKVGEGNYQNLSNGFYQNGRDLFLIEMAKWELDKKDLVPNLNLFSKVTVDDQGNMQFQSDNSSAGNFIDLRAEMDSLVVLNSCQHPLDPTTEYSPKPVKLEIYESGPADENDPCITSRPENARGLINTEAYTCQCHSDRPGV